MSDFDHPKMQVTHSCSPEVEVQTKNAKRYVIWVRTLYFTYPLNVQLGLSMIFLIR